MYDLQNDLLEALNATPEILNALLKDISQERARSAQGGDENWSIVDVVCHLRDAEEFTLARLRSMRDRDNPSISGYDQLALARERDYQHTELRSALSGFLANRKAYVTELSELKTEDWQRSGEHNEFGHITILEHAIHHASHDAIHCAQIARQLSAEE